jgi:hypothetical protein
MPYGRAPNVGGRRQTKNKDPAAQTPGIISVATNQRDKFATVNVHRLKVVEEENVYARSTQQSYLFGKPLTRRPEIKTTSRMLDMGRGTQEKAIIGCRADLVAGSLEYRIEGEANGWKEGRIMWKKTTKTAR